MELWDVYDINKKKLEKVIDRNSDQLLGEGEYHLGAQAIIINSKKQILISKRSDTKNKYPLLWECNGGAVKSGEKSIQGIIRELKEELGLQFCEKKAIFYKCIRDDDLKLFKDIWIFNEDVNIDRVSFKDHEVIDIKWVTLAELNNMKKKNMLVPKFNLGKEEFENIISLIKDNRIDSNF